MKTHLNDVKNFHQGRGIFPQLALTCLLFLPAAVTVNACAAINIVLVTWLVPAVKVNQTAAPIMLGAAV